MKNYQAQPKKIKKVIDRVEREHDLIYRYTYRNDQGEPILVLRDQDYNHYETSQTGQMLVFGE